MTGGTGTGPVGRNIVLNTVDLNPVCYDMAVIAELSRRIVGEVVGANYTEWAKPS